MKSLIWFTLLLSALTVSMIAYTVFRGYTTCYWLRPRAVILINRSPVSGSVHQSSRSMIVTRRDTSHSYLVRFDDFEKQAVSDCQSWIAPRSPIILRNHQNPPCRIWPFHGIEPPVLPESAVGPAQIGPDYVEFRTRAGDVIRVRR